MHTRHVVGTEYLYEKSLIGICYLLFVSLQQIVSKSDTSQWKFNYQNIICLLIHSRDATNIHHLVLY